MNECSRLFRAPTETARLGIFFLLEEKNVKENKDETLLSNLADHFKYGITFYRKDGVIYRYDPSIIFKENKNFFEDLVYAKKENENDN